MIPLRKAICGTLFSRSGRQVFPVILQSYSDVSEQPLEQTQSRKTKQFLNDQPLIAERLKTRSVLTVSGPDSLKLLNNLTTNDLSQLTTDETCLHTFFLNAKGRIIHDALIYRPDDDDTLFVECDIASLQALQTHLIMFRSKTDVEIRDVEQDVGVWTVYDPMDIEAATTSGNVGTENRVSSFLGDVDLGEDILLSRDPRMWPLGVRVLAPKDIDVARAMKAAGVRISDATNGTYKSVRYRLGVAEGQTEIGFGRSFPAEINGDQTNAVSPSKSNFTGWSPALNKVEYRMLPLRFHGNASTLSINTEITDRKGKKRSPIGYLRGIQNTFGIGLMHVPSVLADRSCLVGKVLAECIRPPWWKNDIKVSAEDDSLKKVRQ